MLCKSTLKKALDYTDKSHVYYNLIFNAICFVDYKKYHSHKSAYHFIRRTSGRLCIEYWLSVIEPSKSKGKSYPEYAADKNGLSLKSQLRLAIDKAIRHSRDFEKISSIQTHVDHVQKGCVPRCMLWNTQPLYIFSSLSYLFS